MLRLLLAACALSSALAEISHGAHHYGKHHRAPRGGSSSVHRHQDDHGNFDFAYDIKDGYGNVNGRKEKGSHGHVVGSYYLGEIDGRHRSVHYVADKGGFRAEVKTNEAGTKASHPAAARFDSANGKHIPSGHHGHGGYAYSGGYGPPQHYGSGGHHRGYHHAPASRYGHAGYADRGHDHDHYGYPY